MKRSDLVKAIEVELRRPGGFEPSRESLLRRCREYLENPEDIMHEIKADLFDALVLGRQKT